MVCGILILLFVLDRRLLLRVIEIVNEFLQERSQLGFLLPRDFVNDLH